MESQSLKVHLQFALEDAQKAHHQMVEDMKQTGQSEEEVAIENSNWAVFYACYVECRMRSILTGMQSVPNTSWVNPRNLVRPEDEHMPTAHIYGHIIDPEVSEHSRLHVG